MERQPRGPVERSSPPRRSRPREEDERREAARRTEELTIAEAEGDAAQGRAQGDRAPKELVSSIELQEAAARSRERQDRARAGEDEVGAPETRGRSGRRRARRDARLREGAGEADQRAAAEDDGQVAARAGTVVYVMRGDEKVKIQATRRGSSASVMQIVGLSKMRGAGRVDEVDLAKIATDQTVTVHLRRAAGRRAAQGEDHRDREVAAAEIAEPIRARRSA